MWALERVRREQLEVRLDKPLTVFVLKGRREMGSELEGDERHPVPMER